MNIECKCNKELLCKVLCGTVIAIFVVFLIFLAIFSQNNMEQKDILTAIAVQGDNTEVGVARIRFSQNDIVVGNAISHEEGSQDIIINEDGIYQISYQLFGTQDAIATFNFNAVLIVNNEGIDSTFNESPILRENIPNRMTLTSTVILRLNAGDVLNLGGVSIEDITYPNARIDIEKIG